MSETESGRGWLPYVVVGGSVVALAGAGAYFFLRSRRSGGMMTPISRLAARGDLRGLARMGQRYEEEGDLETALACYAAGGKQGDAKCQFKVGVLLSQHVPPHPSLFDRKNPSQMLDPTWWWLMSAKQGDREAQMCLADTLFASGNEIDALTWLRKAAVQDQPQAQLKLGVLLKMRKEESEALRWLKLAAYNGVIEASKILEEITRSETERKTYEPGSPMMQAKEP